MGAGLDRLWAGWRGEYVAGAGADLPQAACVFCAIHAGEAGSDDAAHVVWRGRTAWAVLNAYPYTSGHVLVLPVRHVSGLDELDDAEATELWSAIRSADVAVRAAYSPGGVNIGFNLGAAAGAGVPGHLHGHVLPRWAGDTSFTTSVAELRVLPESLDRTAQRLRDAWPEG